MATISCTTKFDLTASPTKLFAFLDTSNWAGQGIALADVNGCFDKIIDPDGNEYYSNDDFSDSGCDIWIVNSLDNQLAIPLPLNAGVVKQGDYTIIYKVYNKDTEEYYTQEYNFTFSYESPEVCITQDVDCLSPLFKSYDVTSYAKAGAELTLIRAHKLIFPAGSAGAGSPVSTAANTITTNTFYEGTQTTTVGSSLEYTFEDGLIVQDYVSGSLEKLVNCEDICSIACCLRTLESNMRRARTTNTVKYEELRQTFGLVMGYVGLIRFAIQCNKNDLVDIYLGYIKDEANCTDDCRCTDDNAQVVGLGSIGFNIVVATGGAPVEVETVVDGGTTTYYVSLSDTFIASVAALHNTVVAQGTNITVTSSTAGDGTVTYTVNGLSPTVQIANTVFVAKNGNDSTGLIERLDKPFLTVAAARAAIAAGYTGGSAPSATNRIRMVVFSGLWTEAINLLNFVDYDLNDAVFNVSTGQSPLITDNGVAADCVIYGVAELTRSNGGTNPLGVQIGHASSNVTVNAKKILAYNYAIAGSAGTLTVNCPSISSTNAIGILNSGATMVINNAVITSSTSLAVSTQAATVSNLKLTNCKLVAGTATNQAALGNAGTGEVIVKDCIFVADGVGGGIAVTNDVYVYGRCVSNKAVTGAGSLLVGTVANYGFVVDAAVV